MICRRTGSKVAGSLLMSGAVQINRDMTSINTRAYLYWSPFPLMRLGEYFMSIKSIWTLNCWASAAVFPLLSGSGRKSCLDSSVARYSFTASNVMPGTFRRFASRNSFLTPTFPTLSWISFSFPSAQTFLLFIFSENKIYILRKFEIIQLSLQTF